MVTLAPLLEPRFQVEVGQSAETRDISHAHAVRTVAGIAGNDVGFGNSLHVDLLPVATRLRSRRHWRAWAGCCKVAGKVPRGVRAKRGHRAPRVLFLHCFENGLSRVCSWEIVDLLEDVCRTVVQPAAARHVALCLRAVTPSAVCERRRSCRHRVPADAEQWIFHPEDRQFRPLPEFWLSRSCVAR